MNKSDYKGVWTLAESAAGKVLPVSHELLTRGRALADKRKTQLTAVLMCDRVDDDGLAELIQRGADSVRVVQAPELAHFLVEPHAACLVGLIERHKPEIVIAAATTTGRTLMPYVAVKTNAGLTADCTGLDIEPETGNLLQTRPAIGGNIMATIKTPNARPQMATVRPRSTRPPNRDPARRGQIVREPSPVALASRIRFVESIPQKDQHALSEADIVVSAGRGVKKGENVRLVAGLAEALDAAVGPRATSSTAAGWSIRTRWACRARPSARDYTSPSASAGPSSTWPECRPPKPSSPSTATPTPRSSAWPTSASSATCSKSCPC